MAIIRRHTADTVEIAVAFRDLGTGDSLLINAHVPMHAASTMKVPVMLELFRRGETSGALPVHNSFVSIADGSSYSLSPGQDSDTTLYGRIGQQVPVRELIDRMITRSSNLATNLLIDVVGIDAVRKTLADLNLDDGVEFRRGVEDERAFERDISNRCTADGMLRVLRAIEERKAFSAEASEQMLEILHAQEFRSGIPAGLPEGAKVANKTGEISTVAHDAGIVYLPRRRPYALVVLTEWDKDRSSGRKDTIARISRAIYHHLAERGD